MAPPFRILVIEDDRDTLANLRDILELDGHDIVGAGSFGEFEQLVDTEQIGLIISDRRLPDGMIEDFLPAIKARAPQAEIIVVTGYGDMQSTIAAFRLGIADYVLKPIIPDEIRSVVGQMAAKHDMEVKLSEERHFADEVLRTAEAIVLVLDLGGKVVRFNPYFEDLTGWSVDELRGRDWFEACIPEHEAQRVKDIFIATAHDVETRGVVNDVCGRDGQHHRIRWSNTTLKRADGTVHAVLAVGVDISDLEEAQTRALQAERLAAIGQTMAALAHESRNALQRMKAAADVLSLEIQGNANAEEDLRSIHRAAGDLEYLLEEVRSYAAPIQIQPASAALPDVWQRAWRDIAASRGQRDASLVEINGSLPPKVEIDAARIEQVFRNLFENSLAACQDPVRIEIECQTDTDGIEITSRDNGPGLSEEQRKKLFQPFYTTKATGTGLGMSICQRIIEAHHGTIEALNSDDGACFKIRLPRCQ